MSESGIQAKKNTERLDVRGEDYPYPLWYAEEKLEEMGRGEVLEIITDLPGAAEVNIPVLCREKGFSFEIEKDGADYTIRIQKGG